MLAVDFMQQQGYQRIIIIIIIMQLFARFQLDKCCLTVIKRKKIWQVEMVSLLPFLKKGKVSN